jgi:hypothetical protein
VCGLAGDIPVALIISQSVRLVNSPVRRGEAPVETAGRENPVKKIFSYILTSIILYGI